MNNYIVIAIIVGIAVYIFKTKNSPRKIIEENEIRANNNKKCFEEYLSERVEKSEKADIITHINPKEFQEYLNEIHTLKDEGIQEFENIYVKLKEKYKFDEKELVNISVDYCDWYLYQKEYYDPVNDELWNESSYDNQKEAWMKLNEIEKRLKKKLK